MKSTIEYYQIERKQQKIERAFKVELIRVFTTFLFVVILYLCSTNSVFAQNSSQKECFFDFEKYEDHPEVSFVTVSETMMRLASQIIEGDEKGQKDGIQDIPKMIKSLDVIYTQDKELWTTIKADLKKCVKVSKAETMLNYKDSKGNVRVYIVKNDTFKNKIDALFMRAEEKDGDNVFLQMLGKNMDLDQIINIVKNSQIEGMDKFLKLLKEHCCLKAKAKNITQKTFNVKPYKEIEVSGIFHVILVKGKEGRITVKAKEKLFSFVRITSDGKTLKIDSPKQPMKLYGDDHIMIVVPYRSFEKIRTTGISELTAEEGWSGDKLFIESDGHSSVHISKLYVKSIKVRTSGMADLNVTEGTFSGGNFDIESDGHSDVHFSKLNIKSRSIKVHTSGMADLNIAKSTFSGNKLFIESDGHSSVHISKLDVKNIKVRTAGMADLNVAQSTFSGGNLVIESDGHSNVHFSKLDVKSLSLNTAGMADLKLSGSASTLSAEITGNSEINAYDLHIKRASVDALGSADVEISVSEYIKYNASGISNIYYKGSPRLNGKKTFSSSIEQK